MELSQFPSLPLYHNAIIYNFFANCQNTIKTKISVKGGLQFTDI